MTRAAIDRLSNLSPDRQITHLQAHDEANEYVQKQLFPYGDVSRVVVLIATRDFWRDEWRMSAISHWTDEGRVDTRRYLRLKADVKYKSIITGLNVENPVIIDKSQINTGSLIGRMYLEQGIRYSEIYLLKKVARKRICVSFASRQGKFQFADSHEKIRIATELWKKVIVEF